MGKGLRCQNIQRNGIEEIPDAVHASVLDARQVGENRIFHGFAQCPAGLVCGNAGADGKDAVGTARRGGGDIDLRIGLDQILAADDATLAWQVLIRDIAAAGDADEFAKAGSVIVGMSPVSVKSHDKFVAKHGLGIVLASDEGQDVLNAYGVWKEKSMYGKKYMGVERTTLLLDADHKIAAIWPKVKVAGHAEEVLEAVRKL